jgi:hypothetical protein
MFLLISLLVMSLSGLIGYTMAQGEPRIVEADPSPSDVAAGADDMRLSSTATVTWLYEYEMCRHEITINTVAGDELKGLTFTELQKKYPQAHITKFGPNDATLKISFACYCPEHFILKINGGGLSLYHTIAGTSDQEKIKEYQIDADSLSKEEEEELAIGREFPDMEDVTAYTEKLQRNSE